MMCRGLIYTSKLQKTDQNVYISDVTLTWAYGQLLTPNRRKGASHHFKNCQKYNIWDATVTCAYGQLLTPNRRKGARKASRNGLSSRQGRPN